MDKPFAYILVLIQFSSIGWLVQSAYPFNLNITGLILASVAIVLGSWSLWVMRISKIRILPMPHVEAALITSGPYRLLRHPMYTAVLLFTAGISIDYPNWEKVIIWLILLIVLIIKLHWEDRMLNQQFPEYRTYQQKSFKLVPYLY
jgi:protein-S-isoprenylcysteine O-methyltransferase Ste14